MYYLNAVVSRKKIYEQIRKTIKQRSNDKAEEKQGKKLIDLKGDRRETREGPKNGAKTITEIGHTSTERLAIEEILFKRSLKLD